MLEILSSFVISFLIGLLIGMEREQSHPEGTQAIGVRTFILFSLLGTLAASLDQFALTITISAFVFTMILFTYYHSTIQTKIKNDNGITTEIAAGIVFCLGFMIPSANLAAIIISAFVLLVLIERKRLHLFARKKFKPHEIETAVLLIIFAFGFLPILPNRTIDPWDLFNPRNFGILIVTIAGIQFAGYVAIRLLGARFGMALTGFLGGLVSSTAVFASLSPSLNTNPKFKLAIMASAISAILAMLVEIVAIVLVASPTLLLFIITPILVMSIVSMGMVICLLHYQKKQSHFHSKISNPLNLLSVLYTSIFIGLTLILIAIAKRFIGTEGVLLISFLGGLFEIHGISLATALLYLDQHLTINMARLILYTAILASFVSKLFLLWSLTPAKFALQTSLFLLGILVSGGITFWLVY